MKKIIFFVATFLLGLALYPLVARADVLILRTNDPTKNAIDCLSFTLSSTTSNFLFVTEVLKVTGAEKQSQFDVVKEGECYPIEPNPDPNGFDSTGSKVWPQGDFLVEMHVFWKTYLPENFAVDPAREGYIWENRMHDDRFYNDAKYYLGVLFGRSDFRGFSWPVIKKDNPIAHVSENIAINSLTPDIGHSIVDIDSVQTVTTYEVSFKDGTQKKMAYKEFSDLVAANAPTYQDNSSSNGNSYYHWSPQPRSVVPVVLRIIGLLLLSFVIEAIVFYFFGSRRVRNYLWLLLANFISYPLAVGVVWMLEGMFSSLGFWPDTNLGVLLVVWFLAELLVFIVEYFIMWLGLRKHYLKKTDYFVCAYSQRYYCFDWLGSIFLYRIAIS